MAVRAADAWSIARFCALVVEEADDDLMSKSLISIRDVWIDIANECELRGGRVKVAQRPNPRIFSEGRSRSTVSGVYR
jgi:hypothetical protein